MRKNAPFRKSIDRLDALGKLMRKEFASDVAELATFGRSSHPLVVDVDPTSSCNMSCPHCVDKGVRDGARFSSKRLIRLAGEMSRMRIGAAVVVGGGEPLTHPRIDSFLTALRAKNIRVGLVTNGLELASHLKAVSECCSWVRVSLDASNPDTFAGVHGVAKDGFWKVTGAIKALASIGTAVGISFVVMNKNWDEVYSAYELALRLGCAYIEFKPLVSPCTKRIVPLSASRKQGVAATLARITDENSGIEVLQPESLRVSLNGCVPQMKTYANCYACEVRTVITPAGVFPCSYHRGNGSFLLGDIKKQSLAEIWALRKDRRAPVPPHDCDFYCARHEINKAVDYLSANKTTNQAVGAHPAEAGETTIEDSYFI